MTIQFANFLFIHIEIASWEDNIHSYYMVKTNFKIIQYTVSYALTINYYYYTVILLLFFSWIDIADNFLIKLWFRFTLQHGFSD